VSFLTKNIKADGLVMVLNKPQIFKLSFAISIIHRNSVCELQKLTCGLHLSVSPVYIVACTLNNLMNLAPDGENVFVGYIFWKFIFI
jgi:hypothetical protein